MPSLGLGLLVVQGWLYGNGRGGPCPTSFVIAQCSCHDLTEAWWSPVIVEASSKLTFLSTTHAVKTLPPSICSSRHLGQARSWPYSLTQAVIYSCLEAGST